MHPTPLEDIDIAVASLKEKAEAWQEVKCIKRRDLLQQCVDGFPPVARDAAAAAADAHGTSGTGIGDEHSFWVAVLMALIDYRNAMDADGFHRPVALSKRGDRYVADVFPKGALSLFFGGSKTEIWIRKGKPPTRGRIYRDKDRLDWRPSGRVSLVLGAGNHINVVLLDVLHKLFMEDEVVIVKMHPQNAFLGVYIERAYAPLFDQGVIRLVYGDVTEGSYLCRHPDIDNIHLIGSILTFNHVVFGQHPVNQASKPVTEKKVTGELGCMTPMIIVPGDWSDADMDFVASCVVEGVASNSGHSCCALELIVTSERWSKRAQFLEVLKEKFNKRERQAAWYRGSDKRYERFLEQFPSALSLGRCSNGEDTVSPWLFAAGLKPEEANTKDENWCGVLQEVTLPGTPDDTRKFLQDAVKFCNEQCWGSLSCSLIMHPKTIQSHPEAYEDAIESLRYGNVIVNAPPIIGFLPAGTWGAYPGNPLWDAESGNTIKHNTFMFDHPEKSITYAAWRPAPVPFWGDVSNKEAVMEAVMQFLKSPGPLSTASSVIAIMRSDE